MYRHSWDRNSVLLAPHLKCTTENIRNGLIELLKICHGCHLFIPTRKSGSILKYLGLNGFAQTHYVASSMFGVMAVVGLQIVRE